jgi:hypothetical protein
MLRINYANSAIFRPSLAPGGDERDRRTRTPEKCPEADANEDDRAPFPSKRLIL